MTANWREDLKLKRRIGREFCGIFGEPLAGRFEVAQVIGVNPRSLQKIEELAAFRLVVRLADAIGGELPTTNKKAA
jgi:hypothetical protein